MALQIKFRQMLRLLADLLSQDECKTIGILYPVPDHERLDSLEILMKCQKNGYFSESDVSGLEELARSLNRMDMLQIIHQYRSDVDEKADDSMKKRRVHRKCEGKYRYQDAKHKITLGDVELDIEVKYKSSDEGGAASVCSCYTSCMVSIGSNRKCNNPPKFYQEFRLYDDGRLECRLPDVFARGGCNEPVSVIIGEHSDWDILKVLQQKDQDLMELSGMIESLEVIALRQREKVGEQDIKIREQDAAIKDLHSRYSVLQLLIALFFNFYDTFSALNKKKYLYSWTDN